MVVDGGSEFHVDEPESANDIASFTGLTFDLDADLIIHVWLGEESDFVLSIQHIPKGS